MKLMTKKIICLIFSLSFVFFSFVNVLTAPILTRKEKEENEVKKMEMIDKSLIEPRIASERLTLQYRSAGERDPFVSQVVKKEGKVVEQSEELPLPEMSVQGLVWGGLFPQAIINNKVYRIGDSIEEARITNITKEGVEVRFNKKDYKISTSLLSDAKGSNNTKGGSK